MFPQCLNDLNHYILTHKARFQYIDTDRLESPVEWLVETLQGFDAAFVALSVLGCRLRGATAADCARYALDPTVELPFEGTEQAVLDVVLGALHARGVDRASAAQLVELIAIMSEVIGEFGGWSRNRGEVPRA